MKTLKRTNCFSKPLRSVALISRCCAIAWLGLLAPACGSDDDDAGSSTGLSENLHIVPGTKEKQPDGSLEHPFATLTAAVDAIKATPAWDGTIVAHKGRYELTAELALPKNADLKVLAGATFAFGPDVSLHAQRNLQVRGTEAEPVTFTWLQQGSHWGALTNFEKTSLDNVVEYAIFEHGGESQFEGTGVRGALSFADAGGRISHCIFRNNEGDDGLNLKRSPTSVEFSRFESNVGDALDSDGPAIAEIHDCVFINNGNDGVDLGEGSTEHVFNNIMINNGDKGVSVGDTSFPLVDHNLIIGCHVGVGVKDSSDPEVRNNTLYGNGKGVSSYENTSGKGGGLGQFVNNIIWGSKELDIEIIDGAPAFSYSCIQTGYEGAGNLSQENGCADPLFADVENGDFHLKSAGGRWDAATKAWVVDAETSPCIDAGDPNVPVGTETTPNGARVELGAYGGTREASRTPQ
ncbi:MAG: right-handed parallel beta-helix repeat-containing protein [Myxococcota bacterium]